jgi:O-methyltransferase
MKNNEIFNAYNTIKAQKPWRYENSDIFHHRILPFATVAPWLNDVDFLNIYEKVKEHTLVDIYRCYELWTLAKQSSKVDGVILEVVVWRGGTGAILAEATKTKNKKGYCLFYVNI